MILGRQIDFMGVRKIAGAISAVLVLVSIFCLLYTSDAADE